MAAAQEQAVKAPKGMPPQMVADLLKRYAADMQLGNWKETLAHELYDTAILKAGQILRKGEFSLFANPIGERGAYITADATPYTISEEHTNMTEARRLATGRAFIVTGMYANVTILGSTDTKDDEDADASAPADSTPTGVEINAFGQLQDLQHLIGFELVSDEVKFERGKLRRFTSPQGISGVAGNTAAGVGSVANNGMGRGYKLPIPRDIFGNRDFGVTGRVFRDVKINKTTRLEFILDGWLIRSAR
jgi:hypothetical protein